MLRKTGERLTGEKLKDIKLNHINRYKFAIERLTNPKRIIDSACGIGYGTYLLAKAFPECEVIGIDKYSDGIAVAKIKWKTRNNKFEVVELPEYDFDCDAIVSMETIEHVKDDELLMENYSKAPRLICSVPNQGVNPHDPIRDAYHFRHYTKDELEDLLNRYGFIVDKWATQFNKNPGDVRESAKGLCILADCSNARIPA